MFVGSFKGKPPEPLPPLVDSCWQKEGQNAKAIFCICLSESSEPLSGLQIFRLNIINLLGKD